MTDQEIKNLIKYEITHHRHTGVDSLKVLDTPQPTITAPTGGTTIDSQARTAINTIITTLQTLKLIK